MPAFKINPSVVSRPVARCPRKGYAVAMIRAGSLVHLHVAEDWLATHSTDDFRVYLETDDVDSYVLRRLRKSFAGCEMKFGRFNFFEMQFIELF